MNQKEFDNLELLDKEAIQYLAEQLEKSYTVISISTTRSEEGDARFNIIYEGN